MARSLRPWLILSSLLLLVQILHPTGTVGTSALAETGAPSAKKIRFLAASHPFGVGFDQEIEAIVSEYNRLQSDVRIELAHKGRGFSALKELMVGHFAGSAAAIGMIETSEVFAAVQAGAARPIDARAAAALLNGMEPSFVRQSKSDSGELVTLPFLRSAPVLIADQEILFRHFLDPEKLPATWSGLQALTRKLAGKIDAGTGIYALALPLTGEHGLWLLESLAGIPLWNGSAVNSALERPITDLQKLIDHSPRSRGALTMDAGVHDFIGRKTHLLAGSLEILPHLASRAAFRWRAAPLPGLGEGCCMSGAQLAISTPDDPDVWKFLEFLYSPRIATRWTIAGGFLPLNRAWMKTAEWKSQEKKVFGPNSTHSALLNEIFSRGAFPLRAASPDVVRMRSRWERELNRLFGPKEDRIPFKSVRFAPLQAPKASFK